MVVSSVYLKNNLFQTDKIYTSGDSKMYKFFIFSSKNRIVFSV